MDLPEEEKKKDFMNVLGAGEVRNRTDQVVAGQRERVWVNMVGIAVRGT